MSPRRSTRTPAARALEPDLEAHLAAFRRAAVEVIDEAELAARLTGGAAGGRVVRPLRVKFGMDPSSPDLHVGHAVVLRKLRDLQELGHTVVLLVGDATAMVGDPSGRNKLRPQLSREEVRANMRTYTDQAGLVLDMQRTELRHNSEWFDRMGFADVLRLAGRMTVARMVERDTFQRRMAADEPIGIHEFLYPLMQGWDSVELSADVELGGTDQTFNLLVGRDLQRQEGQEPQVVLTTPLLLGLDGRKMSKSYGNTIGLTDPPGEVFGKVMSLPDAEMATWFETLSRVSRDEVRAVLAGHPREAKARLAWELTAWLHGGPAADTARAAFDAQFRDRERPADVPEARWPEAYDEKVVPLANLLNALRLVASSSEARRRVKQGGVRLLERGGAVIEEEVVRDPMLPIEQADLPLRVKYGKRDYVRIVR